MDILQQLNLLFALILLNLAYTIISMSRYIKTHDSINSLSELEMFKDHARKNMYFALIQLSLLIAFNLLAIYGLIFTYKVTLIYILGMDVVIILVGKMGKNLEKRIMGIYVSDPELQEEYDRVCASWRSKPFPDF